jgi:TIR domain/Polyketide cyclase / dehydrase and lipid transport
VLFKGFLSALAFVPVSVEGYPSGRGRQMSGIFISYRRSDEPGYAGRIADRLTAEFGKSVFMDVESLEPGVDFVDRIEEAIGSVDILIVVIGREWDSEDQSGRRRLDDPNDFVRLEIGSALRRDIRVIPVLVRGAEMPNYDELPEELRFLTRKNALRLSDTEWRAGMDRLVGVVGRILSPKPEPSSGHSRPLGPEPVEAGAGPTDERDKGWAEAIIHISVPPAEVASVLQDIEGYPSWLPDLKDVRITRRPQAPGAAGSETEVQMKSRWTAKSAFASGTAVFRWFPNGDVEFRSSGKDKSQLEGRLLVEEHRAGTLVRFRARFVSMGLWSPLVKRKQDELPAALKEALEADLQALSRRLGSRVGDR